MTIENRVSRFKSNDTNQGFTLVELLFVILIMVVLVSFAVPAMQKSIENSAGQSGGAQEIRTFLEAARLEAKMKSSYIWVEIEKLDGQPERYRFTKWRSIDGTDGRRVEGGGFMVPKDLRLDKDPWHLRRVKRPKIVDKINLEIELLAARNRYFRRDFERDVRGESRQFIVFSPVGVCFSPDMQDYFYGAGRRVPNVAPSKTVGGNKTVPVPRAISLKVSNIASKSGLDALGRPIYTEFEYLRLSGSTSTATIADNSLSEEFDIAED